MVRIFHLALLVKACSPDVVDPMVVREVMGDDRRAECPCRIKACSRPEGANEMADKEHQADPDWSQESSFGLLRGQHQDGEDQSGGEDGFQEETLNSGYSFGELRHAGNLMVRGQCLEQGGGDNTSGKLRDDDQDGPPPWQRTDQEKRKRDSGIEETAANTKERPGSDYER